MSEIVFPLLSLDNEHPKRSIANSLSSDKAMNERRYAELQALYEVSLVGNEELDEDAIIRRVTNILNKQLFSDHIGVALRLNESDEFTIHSSYFGVNSEAYEKRFSAGKGVFGQVIQSGKPLRVSDVRTIPDYISGSDREMRSEICVPFFIGETLIGLINAESQKVAAFSEQDEQFLTTAAGLLANSIHKSRLFKSERQRRLEAEVQREVGFALTTSLELTTFFDRLLIGLQKLIPYDSAGVFLLEENDLRFVWGRGLPNRDELLGILMSPDEKLFTETQRTKQFIIIRDVVEDDRFINYGGLDYIRSWMGIPLIDQGEVFGYFTIDAKTAGVFNPEMAETAQTFANQAASAVMKSRMYEKTKKQIAQLEVLHNIDQMITTSFDLKLTLGAFLEKLIAVQGVDAADILSFNHDNNELDFVDSRGFRTNALRFTHLQLNQGFAGRVALTRRMIHIPNLSTEADSFAESTEFSKENFVTYFGVPLITRGEVKGVLEVFHRSSLHVGEDWLDFLHILATQAAIAIENMQLFENLQSSNLELTLAYDSTLEGWAKTLELRDQETEGHSQRVTEMAVRLARNLGLSSDELVHIRRGAMLHDIGKMGVPDSILQKNGPLTDEEWRIMKQHPVYAFNALFNIPFLKRAIEVPYYHHERWDGSGYPVGLSGASIPLSARIFAVVDVYDALTSDRPYRNAWPCEKAIDYIREQSGSHFDPKIVASFLSMLSDKHPCFH